MSLVGWGLLLLMGVALELAVDVRGRHGVLYLGKPLASSVFVAVALHENAMDSGYGQAIFVGLTLSWFGDMFLIPKGAKRWFAAGLVSFLLGHIAYVVAFFVYGGDLSLFWLSVLAVSVPAMLVLRWLWPHVGHPMRSPVVAYVFVISMMLSAAYMAFQSDENYIILLGATLFYLSDLFVARHRFVRSERVNRLVGLPLYYAGQFMLAVTVG